MAEGKFKFIDFLDRVIGDLFQDGLELRKKQWGVIAAAPVSWRDDLQAITELLGAWSVGLYEATCLLARGTGPCRCSRSKGGKMGRKDKPLPEDQRLAAEVAFKSYSQKLENSLQIVCYFRSLYEVLIDSDESFATSITPADLLTHLRELVELCPKDLISAIKYLVVWPVARFLKQELPPKPDGLREEVVKLPFVLFSGGAKGPRRHLRNLAAARPNNRRAMQVFWSWLQGSKRGLPQVPEEFILATKRKHCAALSQQLPPIPGDYLDEFTRDLKELFRGVQSVGVRNLRNEDDVLIRGKVVQWKRDRQLRHWCGNPGWNACASHSRSEGGKTQCVRQWISEKLSELQPQDDPTGKVNEVSSFLRSKHLLPKVLMATIAKWAREDVDEQLEAQVCVIQEPLKARVITKGDARAYYAVMPLQKDCWKHLAAKEEFSLIGRPLAEENLINIDQGTDRVLAASGLKETFEEWVSGDYSAATDGLSLEISQLALRQYMMSIGLSEKDDLWQLASKALGAHKVSYMGRPTMAVILTISCLTILS